MTRFSYSHDINRFDNLTDELRRNIIAQEIAREIRQDQPKVIGVYGWWGSGKSYLLSQVIKQLLDGNKGNKVKVIVGVFEAWKYEMKGDLAPGLIRSFIDVEKGFGNDSILSDPETYKNIGKGLLELISIAGPVLGPAGQASALMSELIKAGIKNIEEYKESLTDTGSQSHVDQVHGKIKELTQGILRSAKKKNRDTEFHLAMFVDDLDRCSPENMVRMFEWLKVHLAVETCTYVMALDHIAAARAIVGRYKDYLGDEQDLSYGFRYLEKLVDNEYELALPVRTELMAIRQVCDTDCYVKVSEYTRARTQGGDFPGVEYMDRLLGLRSLRIPRTMLKIVSKYKHTLEILMSGEHLATSLRKDLGLSYPFWTLFLVAMYYRLDPSDMDDFIRGRGVIYELMNSHEDVPDARWPKDETSPEYEFCFFAREFNKLAGASMPIPHSDKLQRLAAIIRESTISGAP